MDFIIENNFLRVTVSSFGAELTSVINKETGAEMLWQADPAVWNRHAPVLFPYCGQLKDKKFTHKGVTYEGGGHGFARDMEHTLVSRDADTVTLCLEANALTMEKFPFAFKFTTTYALEGNAVHHAVKVENDGDEPLHFGMGYHPGVLCPFDANHTVEDYAVVFDTPETPTVIETSSTTGLVTGKTYTYFENGTEIALHDHLFDSDSICFKALKSTTMALVEKDTGRRIVFDVANFPYVLIWSAKGPMQFICIEPWFGLPDTETVTGEWMEKPATVKLAPAAEWGTTLTMHFER